MGAEIINYWWGNGDAPLEREQTRSQEHEYKHQALNIKIRHLSMQDINNMRKLDNESALSCLLVGEPRKEWFWKPGQKPLPFRRDWIWMIRSEVELAQQHVSAVFYKVLNLQLAFVLDQFLAC